MSKTWQVNLIWGFSSARVKLRVFFPSPFCTPFCSPSEWQSFQKCKWTTTFPCSVYQVFASKCISNVNIRRQRQLTLTSNSPVVLQHCQTGCCERKVATELWVSPSVLSIVAGGTAEGQRKRHRRRKGIEVDVLGKWLAVWKGHSDV